MTMNQTEEMSTGMLVRRLSENVSRLIRDELRLARLEIAEKGKRAGVGAGLLGGAGLVAALGAAAIVAGLIMLLALVLPAWASALIIGGALLVVAAVLGMLGKVQVTHAVPPTPQEAIRGMRTDVELMKEKARR